jgi:hypothetical protein
MAVRQKKVGTPALKFPTDLRWNSSFQFNEVSERRWREQ